MKIVERVELIRGDKTRNTQEWRDATENVIQAIQATDWPHGSGTFTIYPQSGKKRNEGNGVTPIKIPCINYLSSRGWLIERYPLPHDGILRPGDLDALLETSIGNIGFEWETGNISSSHRAIDKLLLAIHQNIISGGFLVVPGAKLKLYLTDRIGNIDELRPYFPLWSSLYNLQGAIDIFVVEYDATSTSVPKIPKGTDGRSLS